MVETILASEIPLHKLEADFGLQFIEDGQFFREWVDDLPELMEFERQFLDRVKSSYLNLVKYPPMLENTVKMVVLSPLLHLAGFFLPPFYIKTEQEVEIAVEDEETIVKGKIDILVLKQGFWVLAIESKREAISPEVGLAQILSYMLANPDNDLPSLGMLTNGSYFRFVKLTKQDSPRYALSDSFDIRNRDNQLYNVLKIMKRLAQIFSQ